MSEPKPQQEPSMEEILASIRRIISEDGAGAGEAKAAAPAPAPEPAPEPAAEKADVLELTEVVEDEPEEPANPEPAPEPPADEEIELRDEAPAAEPAPVERIVPTPPPPPPAQQASESALIGAAAAAATTSALTTLVQAVDASRGGTPIGQGNRTIEDLVKEVMRPMIKDWLDVNLPRLVERLVRKEVERLSRGAEGE